MFTDIILLLLSILYMVFSDGPVFKTITCLRRFHRSHDNGIGQLFLLLLWWLLLILNCFFIRKNFARKHATENIGITNLEKVHLKSAN